MIETGRRFDTDETRALRAAMVAALVEDGELPDERWRRAFETVPRHLLVPEFYAADVLVDGSADRERWLKLVYSDTTVITQRQHGVPTSSGTMPSLVAPMLHALSVEDGDRVLQVATGTGYTAALLCERLGSGNVVSIEIDPDLTTAARERLQHCGYTPAVITGDGTQGYPDAAPYDRCVATFGVVRVPEPWLRQVRPGGVIVAPVCYGLARLTVTAPGQAHGPFIGPGYFIRPRGSGVARSVNPPRLARAPEWPERTTDVGGAVHTDPDFRFVLAFTCPEVVWTYADDRDNIRVIAPDGSYARVTSDGHLIQVGQRRVWDDIEHIHRTWRSLGAPARERFGLTAIPDQQHIWLDSPDSAHRWVL